MYVIMVRGRKYRYETLEQAKSVASAIFVKTGVVVGISKTTQKGAKP